MDAFHDIPCFAVRSSLEVVFRVLIEEDLKSTVDILRRFCIIGTTNEAC